MSTNSNPQHTYEQWRELLSHELDVVVLDDEGHRRCAGEGRLARPLTRQQAERYFAWNSFVRRTAGAVSSA